MSWPTDIPADTFAPIAGRNDHHLEVLLADGQVSDVRLDGQSVWPTWFKIEWKGNGELSAKVKGVRLSTRYGDRITIRPLPPA
jgi:hypothetical protein